MNAKNLILSERKTRINKIKELVENNKNENTWSVRARGQVHKCPIILLDINIPIYRLENGRTIGEQLNYINTRNKDSNYFLKNIENVEAHIVQHNFLLELSKDPKANVFEEFQKNKKIDETRGPLILTKDGTVINGNRRLAAFRELFWDSPGTYTNFQYIPCAILELDLTPLEIDEIENELQIQKENKLDYSWTNELLKMKREKKLREQNGNINTQMIIEQIRVSTGLKHNSEVTFKLRMLELVDGYLELINEQNNYLLAKDSEQIVKTFQQHIDKANSTQEKEAKKTLAYQMMYRSKDFGDRAFSFHELLSPDNFQQVQQLLVKKITGGNKDLNTIFKERRKNTVKGGSDILDEFVSEFQSDEEKTEIMDDIIKESMDLNDQSFTGTFKNIRDALRVEKGKVSHLRNVEDALEKIKITDANYKNIDPNHREKIHKILLKIEKVCKKIINTKTISH